MARAGLFLHERPESGAGEHAEAAVLDRGDAGRARHGADRRHFADQPPRPHVAQDRLAPVRREHGNLKPAADDQIDVVRSEEHTSELQSLMRISYAVFCLKKKKNKRYKSLLKHLYQTNIN